MKVVFKIIKTGSGNDVYFTRLAEALNRANIETEFVYFHKFFQFFPFLLKLYNKKIYSDVVHTNVEYGWALKEKHKPLVVSLLHNVFDKEYQKDVTLLQKIFHYLIVKPNIQKSLRTADKVVAISEYTKKTFKTYFHHDAIEVIYCSLDTEKYKPLPIKKNDTRFRLLYVGNLTKRKGADLLPLILNKLGKGYVLYYTSGLRTKVPEMFNLPNMIPLGRLTEEQLIQEYNKCDALISPSRLEGFGYAAAEAMACGKPVIASNYSSLPEIVTNKINGYLCSTTDCKDYIRSIIYLKEANNLKKFKKENIKKIKDKFDTQTIAKQYEKLYI